MKNSKQTDIRERLSLVISDLKDRELINSQKDIADKIGYTPSRLSEVMNGRTKVNLGFLQKFCIEFDQSLDYLVFGISSKTKSAKNLLNKNEEKNEEDFEDKPNAQITSSFENQDTETSKTKSEKNLTLLKGKEKGKVFDKKPNAQKYSAMEEEVERLRAVVADQAEALAGMSQAMGQVLALFNTTGMSEPSEAMLLLEKMMSGEMSIEEQREMAQRIAKDQDERYEAATKKGKPPKEKPNNQS